MATPLSLLKDCVEKNCGEETGRKRDREKKTLFVPRKYFSRVKASGSLYNTPSELQSLLHVTRSSDSLVENVMTLNFRLIYRSVGEDSITNFLPKGSHDETGKLLIAVFRSFFYVTFYLTLSDKTSYVTMI